MNNSPAQIIQQLLTGPSGALFSNPPAAPAKPTLPWPMYVSSMPDLDLEGIAAAYDTEGIVIARFLASGKNQQNFGVMLRVRSISYAAGYTILSKACSDVLAKVRRMPITVGENSYAIDTISQTSPVHSAGQDERRRAYLTVNLLVMLLGY